MQFSLVALFALVAAVSAAPAPARVRRQSQCDLATCLLALAPSAVSCGSAAAQAGIDPVSDISCLIAAATDVDQLPASCNGCLDQVESEAKSIF
ncbi:hypothetical protein FB45DRAFT_1029964 [Roridomyces roridus]|uniref:Fungal calcium binding protein domain-containing protein n=1 Tax=Roridomyces roridus TaxID=1738132 RepID=A0AAD7BNE6_9AGAR|nr:hypothetical protein FB45DRAFT_1029964 [Roridomyces roridus]